MSKYYQDKKGIWWYEWGSTSSGNFRKSKARKKECLNCGKEFLTLHKQTIYCSRRCSGLHTSYKTVPKRAGEFHYNWQGGRRKDSKGYVYVYAPSHPYAKQHKRYVLEHRLVMEKHLGRYLQPHEYVHHKNGIKNDNRIENLEIVVNETHYGKVQCPHCQKVFLVK